MFHDTEHRWSLTGHLARGKEAQVGYTVPDYLISFMMIGTIKVPGTYAGVINLLHVTASRTTSADCEILELMLVTQ